MPRIREAIVVEGKYDKIKLGGLIDGVILCTGGFRIYKDKEMQQMLRALAKKQGLAVLTDSDAAVEAVEVKFLKLFRRGQADQPLEIQLLEVLLLPVQQIDPVEMPELDVLQQLVFLLKDHPVPAFPVSQTLVACHSILRTGFCCRVSNTPIPGPSRSQMPFGLSTASQASCFIIA